MQQLGELQQSANELNNKAQVYVFSSDTPENSLQLVETTSTTLPVLLDQDLSVARSLDFLPKPGQPMGGMSGVAQMGFVVIDADGVIRVQRADINFGDHASQILQILDVISRPQSSVAPVSTTGRIVPTHRLYTYTG